MILEIEGGMSLDILSVKPSRIDLLVLKIFRHTTR